MLMLIRSPPRKIKAVAKERGSSLGRLSATGILPKPLSANPEAGSPSNSARQRKSAPQGSAFKVPASGAERAGEIHERARTDLVPSKADFLSDGLA